MDTHTHTQSERADISVTFLKFDMDRQQVQVFHQSTKKSGHLETFYAIEALGPAMNKTRFTKYAKVQSCVTQTLENHESAADLEKKKKLVHVLSIGGSREAGMGVGRSN